MLRWVASSLALLSCAHAAPRMPAAMSYLDARSLDWIEHTPPISNFPCAISCHTTHAALLAGGANAKVRERIEKRVLETAVWTEATPFYSQLDKPVGQQSLATEAVMNAATLLLDDASHARPLAAATLRALDDMWQLQRDDGGWDWLTFDLEPWEAREDWGAALAALAVGSAPPGYLDDEVIRVRVEHLRSFLRDRLPAMALHDQLMLAWASTRLQGLLSAEERADILGKVEATRRPDGGFALAAWGRGKLAHADAPSDGYATAFVTRIQCGVGNRDAARRGLAWLSAHQRADGSWPGVSVNTTDSINQQYMTDAATAYAVMAIAACGQVR